MCGAAEYAFVVITVITRSNFLLTSVVVTGFVFQKAAWSF
jgi:hypothetical protein